MKPKTRTVEPRSRLPFDADAYLGSTGPARKVVQFRPGEVVFTQGDPANDVRYLQKGAIKVSVLSRTGKEAVVAMLGPGDFFGEMGLIENAPRNASVTASSPLTAVVMTGSAFRQIDRELPEVAKQIRKAIDERCRHLAPVE